MKYLNIILIQLALIATACSDSESGTEPDLPQPLPPINENGYVFTISPHRELNKISPYIYGLNVDKNFSHSTIDPATMVRLGGNRLTGFNWENNASNAGADWQHYSDDYLSRETVVGSDGNVPGSVALQFVKNCHNAGQFPLMTIPICYSVAADKNGPVNQGDASRWRTMLPKKNGEFSLSPDLNDEYVFADECVNYLTIMGGGRGKIAYSLDNEPDLWSHTHPRICPEKVSCEEFLNRTIEFAEAVKDVDSDAPVFGFASFGYNGYTSFNDAPDWKQQKAMGYEWFIDYYLDKVQKASVAKGKKLVDVIDLHWYPEAKGDNRIVSGDANTEKDKRARLQATRSLWDETYHENSWIASQSKNFLPLLPNLKKSISKYAPEMKLAFMEFQYGGYEDITGTIALGEALGIFGKYDVYAAAHWGYPGSWGILAYELYRNYDGKGSSYGDTNVDCKLNKNWENSSVFASTDAGGILHSIVTNKNFDTPIKGQFRIDSTEQYISATVYIVKNGSSKISCEENVDIENNCFSYTLPPLSIAHIVMIKKN